MAFTVTEYTLVVSRADYSMSGALTTDDEQVAKVVLQALRDRGLLCGVMINESLHANRTLTTDEEWV